MSTGAVEAPVSLDYQRMKDPMKSEAQEVMKVWRGNDEPRSGIAFSNRGGEFDKVEKLAEMDRLVIFTSALRRPKTQLP